MTPNLKNLKVKIYADGADREGMLSLYKNEFVSGFTTNPTLMAKAGVKDYRAFAKDILSVIKDRPISFEVFSDDLNEMERQAMDITTWAPNVYTKIPVINTKGVDCTPLCKKLSNAGVRLNVTAILTLDQTDMVVRAIKDGAPSIVSVFAGRVADTGRDPKPLMLECAGICRSAPQAELLWASCRELYNIFEADQVGCKIITVPHDVLKKLSGVGKDLYEVSVDTVKTFYADSTKAGFKL